MLVNAILIILLQAVLLAEWGFLYVRERSSSDLWGTKEVRRRVGVFKNNQEKRRGLLTLILYLAEVGEI